MQRRRIRWVSVRYPSLPSLKWTRSFRGMGGWQLVSRGRLGHVTRAAVCEPRARNSNTLLLVFACITLFYHHPPKHLLYIWASFIRAQARKITSKINKRMPQHTLVQILCNASSWGDLCSRQEAVFRLTKVRGRRVWQTGGCL